MQEAPQHRCSIDLLDKEDSELSWRRVSTNTSWRLKNLSNSKAATFCILTIYFEEWTRSCPVSIMFFSRWSWLDEETRQRTVLFCRAICFCQATRRPRVGDFLILQHCFKGNCTQLDQLWQLFRNERPGMHWILESVDAPARHDWFWGGRSEFWVTTIKSPASVWDLPSLTMIICEKSSLRQLHQPRRSKKLCRVHCIFWWEKVETSFFVSSIHFVPRSLIWHKSGMYLCMHFHIAHGAKNMLCCTIKAVLNSN